MARDYRIDVDIVMQILNDKKIVQRLKSVEGSVKKLETTVKKSDTTFKKQGVVVNGATVKFKKLETAVKKNNTSMQKLGQSMTTQFTSWKTTNNIIDKHGDKIKRTQTRYQEVRGTMEKFSRTQKKVEGRWITMSAASAASGNRLNSLLGSFTRFRWLLVNVTMALGAVYGAYRLLIKPVIELETEMTTVRKRTKMTRDEIKRLEGAFINLSRIMPVSAEELAKIGGIAGQLGIRGSENILKFTKVVAMMGSATVLTSEEAGLALAKISKAFGLPITQAENMGSVINELSNTTAANSKEIAASMLKMATSAHQLGIILPISAAISATLIDMGMRAERAGTRMRTAFTRMATETESIARVFDTTSSVIETRIGEDANKVFIDLLYRLTQITDKTQRLTISTDIFGRVGASAVNGLVSNFIDLQRNILLASDEFKHAASLQREFDIAMETTANQWLILWGNLKASTTDYFRASNSGFGQYLQDVNKAIAATRLLEDIKRELGVETDRHRSMFQELFIDQPKMHIVSSLEDFLATYKDLTKEEEIELSFRYLEEIEGYDAAKQFLIDKKVELKKLSIVELTSAEEIKAIEDIAEARVNFYKSHEDGTSAMLAADKKLQIEEEKLNKLTFEQSTRIKELSAIRANSLLGLEKESTIINELQNRQDDYNEELKILQETYALTDMTLEEYTERLEILKLSYPLVMKYQDLMNSKLNDTNKILNDLIKEIERFQNAYDKAILTDYNYALSKLSIEYAEYLDLASRTGDVTKKEVDQWYSASLAILQKDEFLRQLTRTTADYRKQITTQNKVLSDYKDKLSDVNKEIAELSAPRFVGQLGIENLMTGFDRFVKAEEFFERTGVSAQEFLQKAISMSNIELKAFLETFKKVNDQTITGKSSYEAWRETVETFIRETVKSGNELSMNVSESIRKYQTLLLSTSKFTEETSKQESGVTLLKDAYELYYGSMTEDVKQAIQAHKEESITIHESAGSVIDALKNQWISQEEYTSAVERTQGQIELLNDKLLEAQEIGYNFTKTIEGEVKALSELRDMANSAASAVGKISGGGVRGGGLMTAGPSAFAQVGAGFTKYNDFIMRPGQPAASFSADDTIMGFKGDAPTGGTNEITIQNINISGVSSDPSEFAYKFVEEIKREMRTM